MFFVYLIHLDTPLHHARHYIGYTADLDNRMIQHHSGNGSHMLRACNRLGIAYDIVRTWRVKNKYCNRAVAIERQLKRRHKSSELCPICNQNWRAMGRFKNIISKKMKSINE